MEKLLLDTMRLHPKVCAWRAVMVVVILLAKQSEGFFDNELDDSCKQDPRTRYSEAINLDTVSYEQLKEMMATGNVQLFDVRNPDEFEEGFIPGATNIPLGDLEDAFIMAPDQFRQHYGVSMPGKSDCNLILHCQRGHRSLTALTIVQSLGFFRARHYAGGFNEWAELEA